MRSFLRLALAAVITALALNIPSAGADPLPEPEGQVILTISGKIAHTTDGKAARFDLNQLESIGTDQVKTTTPWHEGAVTFEGVLASRILAHVGAKGSQATAVALNDYRAEIPLSDLLEKGVLLAFKANGHYLSVRDKGPVFIIYPFDSNEALRNETHFARSVWQLNELQIR